MCKKLISILAVILLSIGAYAQPKLVTGTVVDGSGLSVIGASIVEKGTQNGVITDLDGHYSINVQAGATLEVSSIGYKTVLVTVGTQNVYDVTLEVDQLLLDEVVVVGYGVMKKSDLSGASTSIKESDLKGSIITSLDQSLQGRAAGVTSVQTSGAPGSSSSIRVRGQATINANAEPLYVIDGVIVQGGGNSGADFGLGDALGNGKVSTISPLSTINPADIVSMEILKDASATAIYGAQGANGVVLITTKRGKAGEAKISFTPDHKARPYEPPRIRPVLQRPRRNRRAQHGGPDLRHPFTPRSRYQLAERNLPHRPPAPASAVSFRR